MQPNPWIDTLLEHPMFPQSFLGWPEAQRGQNPDDGESLPHQKLLPIHQRALDVRGDCRGLGTAEEEDRTFGRVRQEEDTPELFSQIQAPQPSTRM